MQASHTPTVLVIGSVTDHHHLTTLATILEEADITVVTSAVPVEGGGQFGFPAEVSRSQPSVTILLMDQQNIAVGEDLVGVLGSLPEDCPLIVAAQNFGARQIRALLEMGVTDFITPPFSRASVLPRVWRLLRHYSQRSENRGTLQERLALIRLGLIGNSALFLEELRKIRLLARCDITVMLWGETGTGKELVARAVHYLSPRCDRPFVPIDCGAMPPELTESELFGHERGAFTGAVSRNRGLIAAANHGTLFLDEIDALSLAVQAKLLRFIQERAYRPLGSSEIKEADVRIISATNRDLQQRVRDNQFREDLFYRLNVVQLRLPGLRQRSDDVIMLARHFAEKYAARFHQPGREFSRRALQKLLLYQWPGNIRELENVVEAAVALCDGPIIRAGDLPLPQEQSPDQLSFREAKAQTVNEFERQYLVRLLRACGGNVSEAARAAGKNRRAFWELVRKHRVDVRGLQDGSDEAIARKPSVRAAIGGR